MPQRRDTRISDWRNYGYHGKKWKTDDDDKAIKMVEEAIKREERSKRIRFSSDNRRTARFQHRSPRNTNRFQHRSSARFQRRSPRNTNRFQPRSSRNTPALISCLLLSCAIIECEEIK